MANRTPLLFSKNYMLRHPIMA